MIGFVIAAGAGVIAGFILSKPASRWWYGTADWPGVGLTVVGTFACRLFGHPGLKPGALFGACRRCGEIHNQRRGWRS